MKKIFPQPQKGSAIFLVPSLITLSAMCAGFFAIFASSKGHFAQAYYLILLAMLLDSLDGRVARLTHTSSPFGAQLDSLADMVSFGIAPALILYNWHLYALGRIGGIVVFIYAACAALRLARFNIMLGGGDKRYFIGLPSTAAAPVVVGYVWLCYYFDLDSRFYVILGALVSLFSAFSMVSNVKFYSFKEFHFYHKARFRVLLVFLAFLALLVIFPALMVYLTFVVYAITGYLALLLRRVLKK